jgi:tRNA C32,U32 (ribose-2'-O)-methylase TrmJ
MDEFKGIASLIDNFGFGVIFAILVWKFPSIIVAFNSGIQQIMGHVREQQKEALVAYKESNDKMLGMFGERFEKVEDTLQQLLTTQNIILEEIRIVKTDVQEVQHRVGELERDGTRQDVG